MALAMARGQEKRRQSSHAGVGWESIGACDRKPCMALVWDGVGVVDEGRRQLRACRDDLTLSLDSSYWGKW